jgi:chromosome segregation ATPase
MFKKIIIGVLVLTACVWVARKTQVGSYASTLITCGKDSLRGQIPRDLELARVQHEIQQLDRDYQGLLGPIAEKMALVKKLEREISTEKAALQDQRDGLLALTKSIESKESLISYSGGSYNLGQAKVKLAKDVAVFKKLEIRVSTKEKLLDAEARNLAATRDQLQKLIDQKRDFEIRLAELEAEEATLKVARVQTPLQTDEGRIADIKRTLDQIAHSQSVEQQKRLLQQQYGSRISDAQPSVQGQSVDLDEIRDYLQSK